MTVVNAIRFDEYSGAMVCDEQVSWGNMIRKGDIGDKIRAVVSPEIQKKYGIAAAYGGSGTSSVSEEIKQLTQQLVKEESKQRLRIPGSGSEKFLTIREIADKVFQHLSELKRNHVDEFLLQNYGFRGKDLIRGYYEKNKTRIDIVQKEIIDDAQAAMTWKGRYPKLGFLYVNRGILAGYEPKEGFRIFYLNMMTFSYEPVQAVFQSIGSGQDTSDLAFADFVGAKTVQERRMRLDPLESMVSIIHATNMASMNDVGVGGYYNIVVIDGRKSNEDRLCEISDDRAKLASEAVAAYKAEIITRKLAYDTVGDLVFGNIPFDKAEKNLFKRCKCERLLSHFMRGYKLDENFLDKMVSPK